MRVYTKRNTTSYNDALLVERRGLDLIRSVLVQKGISDIAVPEVVGADHDHLSLRLIDQKPASDSQMQMLGIGLSKMHQYRSDFYGLEYDNYIGMNPQKNGLANNWGQLFTEQRLRFQVELISKQTLKKQFSGALKKSKKRLVEFLNATSEEPSLVHGDLWSGNVLFDEKQIWLIDPAVYFGDREVDIAMTEMFGGFSSNFYESYQLESPLSPEYPIKKEIYNLYHYLNHYNLFGSGYLNACEERMRIIVDL